MKSLALLGLITAALVLPLILSFGDVRESKSSHFSIGLEVETIAFDQPEEANEFSLLKRSTDGHTPIPVQRYFDAIEHSRHMPQYSTATRMFASSIKDLQIFSIEAPALGSWTSLG